MCTQSVYIGKALLRQVIHIMQHVGNDSGPGDIFRTVLCVGCTTSNWLSMGQHQIYEMPCMQCSTNMSDPQSHIRSMQTVEVPLVPLTLINWIRHRDNEHRYLQAQHGSIDVCAFIAYSCERADAESFDLLIHCPGCSASCLNALGVTMHKLAGSKTYIKQSN